MKGSQKVKVPESVKQAWQGGELGAGAAARAWRGRHRRWPARSKQSNEVLHPDVRLPQNGPQYAPVHFSMRGDNGLRKWIVPPHNDMATVYLHEGVHENFMFALKAARPGWFMVPGTLIGGGKENVPQFLQGMVQSACLWACPGVGFQHEQS